MKIQGVLLTLCCFLLLACEDDGNGVNPAPVVPAADKENPAIDLQAPIQGKSVHVLHRLAIQAIVSDNAGIYHIKSYLVNPSHPDQRLTVGESLFEETKKRLEYNESIRLPIEILPGEYTLFLDAKDKANNAVSRSVGIMVHDSDLDAVAFDEVYRTISLYSTLDWLGYSHTSQNGLDENGIGFAFHLMADNDWDELISVTEWNQFMSDFDFTDMELNDWDTDKDVKLSRAEFTKAVNSLDLLNAWDLNKDGYLAENEMGKGIFDRWDLDRNQRLSRGEYHQKFRTQFHFSW